MTLSNGNRWIPRTALMFSLIWAWTNSWVNNCEAGDLRRQRAHYNVIVIPQPKTVSKFVCLFGPDIPELNLESCNHETSPRGGFNGFSVAGCDQKCQWMLQTICFINCLGKWITVRFHKNDKYRHLGKIKSGFRISLHENKFEFLCFFAYNHMILVSRFKTQISFCSN